MWSKVVSALVIDPIYRNPNYHKFGHTILSCLQFFRNAKHTLKKSFFQILFYQSGFNSDISDWNTENVITMSNIFNNAGAFNSVSKTENNNTYDTITY